MNDKEPRTLISCKGVTKSFTSQAETLNVLRGIDLEISRGVTCAIMGASGSGKSTLLSIIGGMEKLDSGELAIGPYKLHALQEKELSDYRSDFVGFVFQFHHLLKDFTALENVALPAYMRGSSRKSAWGHAAELLEKVGLATRLHHYPSELSGGERQRAAIARALSNAPALVLADEPTGNLDAENASAVRELLFELPSLTGATLLIATHDPKLAEYADQQYFLEKGVLRSL